MLQLLDIIFTLLHLLIVVFNCTGWIWKKTRKAHLFVILMTTFSWFVLGIWKGWGYCFLTDWAWQIKYKLGVTDLPNSFIQYCFNAIGIQIHPSYTDLITATTFFICLALSITLNWKDRFRP